MASWMTALGSMGSSITSTKDVYKPTDNITSTWSSLAQNLIAVAGTIGLTALKNKVASNSGLQPSLARTASGAPIPTISQSGMQGYGAGLTPQKAQTGLFLLAGAAVVGVVLLMFMQRSGR